MAEPIEIKAAVLYEHGGEMAIESVVLDPPKTNEVLIRVMASGVCHSDLHQLHGDIPGPVPIILGHEGAGVVEEVGDGVTHVAPGDQVVLSWVPFCGHCRFCARGRYSICENLGWSEDGFLADGTVRFHRDGADVHHCVATSTFTEFTVVPAQCAIKVEPGVPFEQLAVLGCAVLTGVGAVFNAAQVGPQETVAVVGCGGVGLSAVMAAAAVGAGAVVAIDINPDSLALAQEVGATHLINPQEGSAVDALNEHFPGGVDYSFEALGKTETIELALELSGRGGVVTLLGMAAAETTAKINPLTLTIEERRIQGCFYGSASPFADIPMLVDLIMDGKLPVDKLITTRPLEDVDDAIADLSRGAVGRSVLVLHEDAN